MAVNKKAVFYTITAVILVVVMIFAFNVFEFKQSLDKNEIILIRVKATDNFVKNLDYDLQRAIRVASLRATLALEEKIVEDGVFLSDASSAYEEAIMNGTIGGVYAELMQDSSFPDWVAKIQSEASKTGVIVDFEVHSIEVYQDDPWNVKGKGNITVNVTDMKNTSSWYQQKEVISPMSIMGLEDPLYAVKT